MRKIVLLLVLAVAFLVLATGCNSTKTVNWKGHSLDCVRYDRSVSCDFQAYHHKYGY